MAKKAAAPKKGLSGGQKLGIGVGLTAAAVAAVGGYFFYGSPDAKKNRTKAKSWMLRAKAEVLEGLEGAKHLTKEEYAELVDRVAKGYKAAKSASGAELAEFAREMHAHWRTIERAGAKKTAKAASKVAQGARKVAAKK